MTAAVFRRPIQLMTQVRDVYGSAMGLGQILTKILYNQFRCKSAGGRSLKQAGARLDQFQ